MNLCISFRFTCTLSHNIISDSELKKKKKKCESEAREVM